MPGTAPHTPPSQLCEPIDGTEAVWDVAFSPTAQHLATATDASVNVWITSAARRWQRMLMLTPGRSTARDDEETRLTAVTFSPDGRRVAAGGESGTLRVWELASGRDVLRIARGVQINGLAFDGEGRRLATAADDGTARILDAATGAQLLALDHDDEANAVTFSADGRRVASASMDTTACIWDAVNGVLLVELEHPSAVWDVAFSPDGVQVATAGEDRAARLWDASTGGLIFELPHRRSLWGKAVTGVAFNPDGRLLASVGMDKAARLWDVATGEQECEMRHADPLWAVAFSPTGECLATASIGVRLWDVTPDGPPREGAGRDMAAERMRDQAAPASDAPPHAGDHTTPTTELQLRPEADLSRVAAAVALLIGLFLTWLLFALDAPASDKAWAAGGAVAAGAGLLLGVAAHLRVDGAAVFPANLVSRRRLGEAEGWDCEVEVIVDRGGRLRLPLHAESKKPRGSFAVALATGDRVLLMGDDPRSADRAELLHPIEQYGLPTALVFFGVLSAGIPFTSG